MPRKRGPGSVNDMSLPTSARQLRSTVGSDGSLELALAEIPIPAPADDEVVIRVEAAPINPSDLGLLLGGAELATATTDGAGVDRKLHASLTPGVAASLQSRFDQSLPVGNEGAGVVVAAGAGAGAQALVGRTVSFRGATYTTYRCVKIADCMALPDGVTAAQGASWFVNPMTALGMVETMRLEGHTALVHTAAASNLGQMLNRICIDEGVSLVNVVRRPEQVELLRSQGAQYVVDSSASTFYDDLVGALTATGATIAFDATGGGKLAGTLLAAMEAAASATATEYSRYGSSTFKQVYIYGGLDRSPTELVRNFGFSWSLGGWLLTPFLMKIGAEGRARLLHRVSSEITTTFASHYTSEISLADVLDLEIARSYAHMHTGQKYLINPAR
jgi:NADPH:quinone reductase